MYKFYITHLQIAENALDEIKEISECIFVKRIVDKADELKKNITEGTYNKDKFEEFIEVLHKCYKEYKKECNENEDILFHDLTKSLNVCNKIKADEERKKEEERKQAEEARKAEEERKKKDEEERKQKQKQKEEDEKKQKTEAAKRTEEVTPPQQQSQSQQSQNETNTSTPPKSGGCCMIM